VAQLSYEVSFKGLASAALQAGFAEFTVRTNAESTIVVCDTDRLRVVLDRVQSYGLDLLGVRLVAQDDRDE
jgi:hypothetical protein